MGSCNCSTFCCALLCVHSSFATVLMGKRELVTLLFFVFLVFCDCCVDLPHSAMGSFAVCVISWPYSLTFFIELSCLNVKLSFLVVALYLALYAQY